MKLARVAIAEEAGPPGPFLNEVKPTPERLREVTRRLVLLRRRCGLSVRQADIVSLIVQGLANKDIASRLRCSEVNVESHMTALLRRTQSSSRAMLVARFWLEFDLAAEDPFEGQVGPGADSLTIHV